MIEAIIALIALSVMEVILGIDNIVFISIATAKLPAELQSLGRKLGLAVALVTRLALLCGIFWIAQLVTPVFTITNVVPAAERLRPYFTEKVRMEDHMSIQLSAAGMDNESSESNGDAAEEHEAVEPKIDEHAWAEFNEVSWRDVILMAGGLFLIFSSVREIHHEVEHEDGLEDAAPSSKVSFIGVVIQVGIMDIIFSLDSVITAVGMANQLWVMVTAVIIAVGIMILFANQVGDFVDQNPTVKMLALAFLLLIGVMLVAEGIGTPISKGYLYFAMSFSLAVEMFNMRKRRLQSPGADIQAA